MIFLAFIGVILFMLLIGWLLFYFLQKLRGVDNPFPTKKFWSTLITSITLIIIGGASTDHVTKTTYDSVVAENKALTEEIETLKTDIQKYASAEQEKVHTDTKEKAEVEAKIEEATTVAQIKGEEMLAAAQQEWQAKEEQYKNQIATLEEEKNTLVAQASQANTNVTNTQTTEAPASNPAVNSSESYKNCTELRKVYPNGVGSDHPAYNTKHDRDKDGWACER